MTRSHTILAAAAAMALNAAVAAEVQQNPPATTTTPPAATEQRPPAPQPLMDPERARRLYVSKDPKDHGLGVDFQRQIQQKAETDKRYAEVTKGVVDFSKVTFRSSVGDMDIPAYLFSRSRSAARRGTRRWSGCTAACTATGASPCGRS
jgi:hypothetical protein